MIILPLMLPNNPELLKIPFGLYIKTKFFEIYPEVLLVNNNNKITHIWFMDSENIKIFKHNLIERKYNILEYRRLAFEIKNDEELTYFLLWAGNLK